MVLTQEHAGTLEAPHWDQASLTGVRNALLELGRLSPPGKRAFGKKHEVDPVEHLIGAAVGWGGNPPDAATYANSCQERRQDNLQIAWRCPSRAMGGPREPYQHSRP
jgi:hypothetical protein